jgi:hypothetical protein
MFNTGRLVAREGVYQPAGDSRSREPDTLHALIAARLDALRRATGRSPGCRVLGQTFTSRHWPG